MESRWLASFGALAWFAQRTISRVQCLLAPRRCGAAASELAGHRGVGNVLLDVLHALLDLLSQLLFGEAEWVCINQ